jgi:hypothetical protein
VRIVGFSAVSIVFLSCAAGELFAQAWNRLPPPGVAGVRLRLVSPEPDSVVDAETLDVFVDVENVEISPEGHRVLVLLGGRMRETITHTLRPATFRGLKPGSYLLRAFVVDRRGAMVRSPEAMVRTFVHMKRPDAELPDPQLPVLTVASPEGVFSHEDGRLILFDFVTSNLRLGERGVRLRYRIGDFTGYLSKSSPVLLTELPPGEHVLFAEVVDEKNEPMPGPYLSAECRFTVLPPAAQVEQVVVADMEQPVVATPVGKPPPAEEWVDVPRLRVVSPEPGLTVLLDDPAWQD